MSQEITEQMLRDAHKHGYNMGFEHGYSRALANHEQYSRLLRIGRKTDALSLRKPGYHRSYWDHSNLRRELGFGPKGKKNDKD